MEKSEQKSLLYAGAAVLIWSTVATAFKLGLREMHYTQLIFVASGVSLVFLFAYLWVTRQLNLLRQTTRKDLLMSSLTGLINPFGYYLVLFKAYSLLPAQLAQPLNMVWPITLAFLSIPLLGQKINWRYFLTMGICFCGIVVLASQGSIEGFRQTSATGVLLAVGSSVLWALYWILNVKDKRNEVVKLFLSFFFGFIYLLIAVSLTSGFHFPRGTSLWAAVYIGIFETGITYVLWMKAMQWSKNNAMTSSLIFAAPFISMFFISAILKEKIMITTIFGLILIVTGIVWQQFFIKRKS